VQEGAVVLTVAEKMKSNLAALLALVLCLGTLAAEIPGYRTTYNVVKAGSGDAVAAGATVSRDESRRILILQRSRMRGRLLG